MKLIKLINFSFFQNSITSYNLKILLSNKKKFKSIELMYTIH